MTYKIKVFTEKKKKPKFRKKEIVIAYVLKTKKGKELYFTSP